MVTVHRGVINDFKKNGTLPSKPSDIYSSLRDLHVADAKRIEVMVMRATGNRQKSAPPSSIVFIPMGPASRSRPPTAVATS